MEPSVGEKRAAIGRRYSVEWAARLSKAQVLAIYPKIGARSIYTTRNGEIIFPKPDKKKNKKKLIDDGTQLSMFGGDAYDK